MFCWNLKHVGCFIGEEILDIDSNTSKNRKDLPPLIIVTPFDKSGIVWSREEPSLIVLRRLMHLAHAALQLIESSMYDSDYHDKMKVSIRCKERAPDISCGTINDGFIPNLHHQKRF